MSENSNSNVLRWKSDIISSIEKINFSYAEKLDTSEPKNSKLFYEKSGFEAVLKLICKSDLFPEIDSLFLTFTTLISSLENQKLSDFVLCGNQEKPYFVQNIKSYYNSLYGFLQENKLGIFYQNHFFKNPVTPSYYLSKSDKLDFNDILTEPVSKLESSLKLLPIKESDAFSPVDTDICNEKTNNTSDYSIANCSVPLDYIKSIGKFSKEGNSEKVIQYHNLLHYCFDKVFYNRNEKNNKKTILVSIPLIGAVGGNNNNKFQGQGACFLYFELKNDSDIFEEKPNLIHDLSVDISYLLKDITYNYLFESGIHLYESVLKKSIESAVGAIMARNISHNIGSHVISALTTQDNSFDKIHIKMFLKYIQQRMDFIAQITTEWPEWTYPAWFLRDIMRRFYLQTFLLEYIALSEGYGAFYYQIKENIGPKIEILVIDKDGESLITNLHTDEIRNDVQVAIPGGVIGIQAFYTILENIIRNSAKHSKRKSKDENLEITIQVINDDKKDYVEFFIFDNNANDENLIKIISDKIKDSFVEETGKLLKENWGIAEIKISTSYLKKTLISKLGKKHNEENNVILFDPKTGDGIIDFIPKKVNGIERYGYNFSIPKPKELLILLDNNSIILEENEDMVNRAKIDNVYFSKKIPNNPDFDFVILNSEFYDKFSNEFNIEKLPFRLFIDKYGKKDKYNNRIAQLSEDCKKIYNDILNCDIEVDFGKFKLLLYKNWIQFIMELNRENEREFKFYLQTHEIGNPERGINYEENIRTLPRIFKSSNSSINNENTSLFTYDFSEYVKPDKISKINELPSPEGLSDNSIAIKRHCAFGGERFYMEALSGSQFYFSLLESDHDFYNANRLFLQISENIFYKLLIIDERITKYYYNKVDDSSSDTYLKLLMGRIYIPRYIKMKNKSSYFDILKKKDINQNSFIKDETIKRYKDNLYLDKEKKIFNIDINQIDEKFNILIIHQAILDKLSDIYKTNSKEIVKNFKEDIPFVIVTSGRGQTNEVLKEEKFLAFSNLNEYLLKEHPEKFILTTQIITKILSK